MSFFSDKNKNDKKIDKLKTGAKEFMDDVAVQDMLVILSQLADKPYSEELEAQIEASGKVLNRIIDASYKLEKIGQMEINENADISEFESVSQKFQDNTKDAIDEVVNGELAQENIKKLLCYSKALSRVVDAFYKFAKMNECEKKIEKTKIERVSVWKGMKKVWKKKTEEDKYREKREACYKQWNIWEKEAREIEWSWREIKAFKQKNYEILKGTYREEGKTRDEEVHKLYKRYEKGNHIFTGTEEEQLAQENSMHDIRQTFIRHIEGMYD